MKEITKRGTVVGVPARREAVIEILHEAFATDLIEMDEFEERVKAAEHAKSIEELDVLVEDLPADPVQGDLMAGAPKIVSSVMGSKRVAGDWLNSRKAEIKNIMSSMELDFRNVHLPPGVTEITVKNIMGSMLIIVPPGLRVINEMKEVMASFEEDPLMSRVKSSGESILRFTGKIIMGSVAIKVK